MTRFANKTVLVTGASSGIGRAIARAFAAEGAQTIVSARRSDALAALADAIAANGWRRPRIVTADLSIRGEAEKLAIGVLHEHGAVDVLVNNAGVGFAGSQLGVGDHDVARAAFETNYWSPLALASTLFASPLAEGERTIVNVTSLIAAVPVALAGHYSSSKAALALATEAMRLELVGRSLHVLHVLPGPIETPMLASLRAMRGAAKLLDRLPRGTPESIAEAIVDGVSKRRAEVVHPATLGFVRHVPTLILEAARRKARPLREGDDRLVVAE